MDNKHIKISKIFKNSKDWVFQKRGRLILVYSLIGVTVAWLQGFKENSMAVEACGRRELCMA